MSRVLNAQGALVNAPAAAAVWPRRFINDQHQSGTPPSRSLDPPAGTKRIEWSWSGVGWTPVFQRTHSRVYVLAANKTRHDGHGSYISIRSASHYTAFHNDQSSHRGAWQIDGVLSKLGNGWVGIITGYWTGNGADWDDGAGDYLAIHGKIWTDQGSTLGLTHLGGESGEMSLYAEAFG